MENFETFMNDAEQAVNEDFDGKPWNRDPKCNFLGRNYKKKNPKKECKKYEEIVYEYFSKKLGWACIEKTYKTENIRIDGIIEMENGNVYYLEIKHTLGWILSCNAIMQFKLAKRFVEIRLKNRNNVECHFKDNHAKPTGGIIVFSEFIKDWDRRNISKGKNEWHGTNVEEHEDTAGNGWREFYKDGKTLGDQFPVRILQLQKKKIGEGLRYYSIKDKKFIFLDRKKK